MNTCKNNNFRTFSVAGVAGRIHRQGGVSNALLDECLVPIGSASGIALEVVTGGGPKVKLNAVIEVDALLDEVITPYDGGESSSLGHAIIIGIADDGEA